MVYSRVWDYGDNKRPNSADTIRIMQFNMLADCLAEGSTPNMFNQVSSRASVAKKKVQF